MMIVFEFTDTYASDAPTDGKRNNPFGIPYPTQDILLDTVAIVTVENADPAHDVDPLSALSLMQSVDVGYLGEAPFQQLQGEGSLFYADALFCDRGKKTPKKEVDVLPVAITGSASYYNTVVLRDVGLIPSHGKQGNVYIELGADTDIVTTAANIVITSFAVTAYAIPYDLEYYNIARAQGKLYRLTTSSPIQKTISGTLVKQSDVLEVGKELIGWITDGYNASTVALTRTQVKDGDKEITDLDYYGYQEIHNLNTNGQVDPDTFINVQCVLLENPYYVTNKSEFKVGSASDVYQLTFLYREPVT